MEDKKIIVYVRGGVPEVDETTIPDGIKVIIRDYDTDGDEENCFTDEEENTYRETEWSN